MTLHGDQRNHWITLVQAVDEVAALLPEDRFIEIMASQPGEPDRPLVPDDLLPDIDVLARDIVLPSLRALDERMPLDRSSPETWETLVFRVSGWSGTGHINVRNAIGTREMVTAFGAAEAGYLRFASWCASRADSEPSETSWDRARSRRLVIDDQGWKTLVDPGAVRIVELAQKFGAETTGSCEGHPQGGYIKFKDTLGWPLLKALRALGSDWTLVGCYDNDCMVEMRRVADVGDRDLVWRKTCAVLERILVPENEADPGLGARGP